MGEYKNSLKTNGVKRIAYSGIEGSFASIAAGKIDAGAERVAFGSFKEAYDAVVSGDCDIAVLPIENSYAGEVGQVTDLMFQGELFVNGVYTLNVIQNLLGVKGASLQTIRKVVSHPQALEQCAEFLRAHNYESIEAVNTARAARQVAQDNDPAVAAIASEETAALYGLQVLAQGINEQQDNSTRFVVLSKNQNQKVCKDCDSGTFIMMFAVKNEAGVAVLTNLLILIF